MDYFTDIYLIMDIRPNLKTIKWTHLVTHPSLHPESRSLIKFRSIKLRSSMLNRITEKNISHASPLPSEARSLVPRSTTECWWLWSKNNNRRLIIGWCPARRTDICTGSRNHFRKNIKFPFNSIHRGIFDYFRYFFWFNYPRNHLKYFHCMDLDINESDTNWIWIHS